VIFKGISKIEFAVLVVGAAMHFLDLLKLLITSFRRLFKRNTPLSLSFLTWWFITEVRQGSISDSMVNVSSAYRVYRTED
jgi:hypothetical protein